MKKLFTFLFLLSAISLFAQPENDDCSGLIDLGVVPFCPVDTFYTNLNATASDIGNDNIPGPGACGNNDITFVGNDVWFKFTTSDTITDYTITVTGIMDMMGSDPMSNPQMMIYRGDCEFDGLALLACGAADDGENVLELDVLDLDPNEMYFIRINDFSSSATPNWGSFQLCIDEIDPINTIDQDGSNACSGELYDSGGPDGDYMANENNVFSICPPLGQNACVTLTLEYFNIENFSDQLIFYDGPDTNSPIISSLNGGGNGNNSGGVCFVAQATSGCLTVQFISDGFTEFEGFGGSWECSAVACDPLQSITVDNDITEQDILDNVSTPQTLVTVDTIDCADGAYGTFTAGDNTDLGLEQGLILTSGSVLNALGPNTQTGLGTNNGFPGDPELDYLGGNVLNSFDACIVELDVFVATDELVFEYVFGSEEYPEYVGGGVNDIFAFLISGPGIDGDVNIANQENIAIIPGTTTPIEIDNVNDNINWEYYRNNTNGISTQYDGLTSDFLGIKKSLTARRTVTPCNTYHLKLAVADRGDGIFDSGVFISEIKGGTPNLSVNFASGLDYLIEDCSGSADELLISLSNPLSDPQTYDVVVSGTAELGVDYTLSIPDEVTIPAGETLLSYPIIPLTDNAIEGTETIIITLTNNFGCGDIELNQIVIELSDAPVVDIFSGQDTAYVCAGECITMEVDGAIDYFWEPVALVDDAFATNPETCPTTSQFLYVTGSVSALPGCADTDTIWLQVVDPTMDVVALGDVNLCEGESVELQAVNNVGNTGLEWTPADGLNNTDQETVTASPDPGEYIYTATVTVSGCSAEDTISVSVNAFDFPQLTTADTLICQGQSVTLAETVQFTNTIYEWTPDLYLDDNTASGPIATPESTTVYTLNAVSPNGACSQTESINVEVLPAAIEIMPEDTTYICLGETATLTASTTTGQVDWFPSNGLSSTTDLVVTADIPESQWYYATMTVGACTILDSVYVRVDSIPDLPIDVLPDTAPYCPGEIITLISPTYEPNDYPDISHAWDPLLGAESEPFNLNFVITTVESATYVRTTQNNACTQTDEIFIEVVDAEDIMVAWTDTTVCGNEPLSNTVFNGENPTWSPASGLSCTECETVDITVQGSTTYTVEIEVDGCPISADVNITVEPNPTANITDDLNLCVGQSVVLNSPSGNLPGTTFTWMSDPADPTLTDPTAESPEVSPTVTTTYSLVVDNGVCDPLETEFTIAVAEDDPIFTYDDEIFICAGDTALALVNSSVDVVLSWTGNGILSTDGASFTAAPDETTTYTAVHTNCDGTTQTLNITVNILNDFSVSISIDPETGEMYDEGAIVTLTATPNPELDDLIYTWGDGQMGQIVTDTLLDRPLTTVSVVATSPDGCEASTSLTVDVIRPEPSFANVFTPGEVENNYFNVIPADIFDIVEFKILTRWGEVVYDNENPSTGWDGKKGDNDLPADVYFYIFKYRTGSGEIVTENGDITLLR